MALLNARLPANITFLLNYFFISQELDFMIVTEKGLHAAESSLFTNLYLLAVLSLVPCELLEKVMDLFYI